MSTSLPMGRAAPPGVKISMSPPEAAMSSGKAGVLLSRVRVVPATAKPIGSGAARVSVYSLLPGGPAATPLATVTIVLMPPFSSSSSQLLNVVRSSAAVLVTASVESPAVAAEVSV